MVIRQAEEALGRFKLGQDHMVTLPEQPNLCRNVPTLYVLSLSCW